MGAITSPDRIPVKTPDKSSVTKNVDKPKAPLGQKEVGIATEISQERAKEKPDPDKVLSDIAKGDEVQKPGNEQTSENAEKEPEPGKELPKSLPEEVVKLRADLGLPEVPRLLDPARIYAEKRQLIDQFVARQEEDLFSQELLTTYGGGTVIKSKGFIDRGEILSEQDRQKIKNAAEQRRSKHRIHRAVGINIMKTIGINNAEEIVRQVEDRLAYLDYADIRNPTFLRGIKGIENIGLAIDRMHSLGFNANSQQFESADFMKALEVFSSIPEEDFAKIPEELNKYFFIENKGGYEVVDHNTNLLYPGFNTVVEIVGKGGLSPEQKQLLDKEYRLAVLKNVVPIRKNNGGVDYVDYKSVLYTVPFEQALNPGISIDEIDNMTVIAEDAVYRYLDHGYLNSGDDNQFTGTRDLAIATIPEGKTVIELIKNGWSCPPSEIGANQKYLDYLDKAVALQQDPDKLAWIATIQEAMGKQVLSTTEVTSYELMYEEKDKMSGLAILAKRADVDLNTFIGGYADFGAKVRVNIDPIRKAVENLSIDDLPEQERVAWGYIKAKFGSLKHEDVDYFSYLVNHKDSFGELFYGYDDMFDPKYLPRAKFMEAILEGKVPVSGLDLDSLMSKFIDFENLSPEIAVANLEKFEGNQVVKLFKNLPDDFIGKLPAQEQDIFRFLKANSSSAPYKFILEHKDKFSEYVVAGVIQPRFLNEYFVQSNDFNLAYALITDELLETFPENERVFWKYFRNKDQSDAQRLLLNKPHDFYVKDGAINDEDVNRDLIREIRARPENCRTYESLTTLFTDLHRNYPKGDEAGLMYLRIAEAHRLRTIGERTEVEAVDALKLAFSELYNPTMTPFEKMAWKILQKQLPFTANEAVREDMRNKALEVEKWDINRLGWVHQSVHNYASIFEVDYLKAFKQYIETGDQNELIRLRDNFSGISQSPIYTEEDRKALLANPNISPKLDELIELTSLFYDIRPETLKNAALTNVPDVFSQNKEFMDLLNTFTREDLPIIAEHEAVDDVVGIRRSAHFALNVNAARRMIYKTLDRPGVTPGEKTYGLVTDTVLDTLSQTIFTRYKDYVKARGNELTQAEVLEATSVLGEVIESAYLNGEIPQEEYERTRLSKDFRHPEQISRPVFHMARLALPFVKHGVDTHWQRFTDLAKPEMVDMLIRTGLPEREAEKRVYDTDLVEFKKSSMTFVMEPLTDVVSEQLARIEPIYGVTSHNPEEEYKTILDGKVTETSTDNPEISAFMQEISSRVMPDDLEGARKFLDTLSQSSEAQAERLARISIPGYMDKGKLQTRYSKIERNGTVLEFYPVEFYGVDMVIILQDGKRVEKPKEFIMENSSVPQVVINSLREGD